MKIVIKRGDGGVSIMQLVDKDADVDAEIEKLKGTLTEGYVSHRVMPDEAVPSDRSFRNAWCDETPEPVIDIDMPKARNIQRDRMRAARAPKLAALDVDYMRALEAGDEQGKNKIVADKQALRDVTADPAIEAAQTPEELKAVWPTILASQKE